MILRLAAKGQPFDSGRSRPGGTVENSPAIHRWVKGSDRSRCPVGTPEARVERFNRPYGTKGVLSATRIPAMNRWAIINCPSGASNAVQKKGPATTTDRAGWPSRPTRSGSGRRIARRGPPSATRNGDNTPPAPLAGPTRRRVGSPRIGSRWESPLDVLWGSAWNSTRTAAPRASRPCLRQPRRRPTRPFRTWGRRIVPRLRGRLRTGSPAPAGVRRGAFPPCAATPPRGSDRRVPAKSIRGSATQDSGPGESFLVHPTQECAGLCPGIFKA